MTSGCALSLMMISIWTGWNLLKGRVCGYAVFNIRLAKDHCSSSCSTYYSPKRNSDPVSTLYASTIEDLIAAAFSPTADGQLKSKKLAPSKDIPKARDNSPLQASIYRSERRGSSSKFGSFNELKDRKEAKTDQRSSSSSRLSYKMLEELSREKYPLQRPSEFIYGRASLSTPKIAQDTEIKAAGGGQRVGQNINSITSLNNIVNSTAGGVKRISNSTSIKEMNINLLIVKYSPKQIAQLLETYKSQYHELRIKTSFVVPKDKAWPKWSHGLQLGQYCARIKYAESIRGKISKEHPVLYQALNDVGFLWKHSDYMSEKTFQALLAYKALHGNLAVPATFVVPSNAADWDPKFWGMSLGRIVQGIRHDNYYPELVARLVENGFDMEAQKRGKNYTVVENALLVYKQQFGNLNINGSFVVAEDDERYPKEMRGSALATVVKSIRNNGAYAEHKERLVELGFDFDSKVGRIPDILTALTCYRSAYPKAKFIPHGYVVPHNITTFPNRMWGMKLGLMYTNIRHRGDFKDLKKKIELMGYDLSTNKRPSFDTALEALRCYKLVNPDDTRVPKSYVVAKKSKAFPEHTWGLKLGLIFHNMATKGTYKKQKQKVLDLGFSLPVHSSGSHDNSESSIGQ